MFEKKTLQQHITDFNQKVLARETKINTRIEELETQASNLKTKIKDQSSQIVELEMSEDSSDVGKLQKSNREIRLQLQEIEDSIQSYQEQLEDRKNPYVKELEKVRIAGNKAAEDRIKETDRLGTEITEIELQLKTLEARLEKARHERYTLGVYTEINTLNQIIGYIDHRAKKLSDYDKERLLKLWLKGDVLDGFFKESKPYNGPATNYYQN